MSNTTSTAFRNISTHIAETIQTKEEISEIVQNEENNESETIHDQYKTVVEELSGIVERKIEVLTELQKLSS